MAYNQWIAHSQLTPGLRRRGSIASTKGKVSSCIYWTRGIGIRGQGGHGDRGRLDKGGMGMAEDGPGCMGLGLGLRTCWWGVG